MDTAATKKEAWKNFQRAVRGESLSKDEKNICIDAYWIGGMDIFSDPNHDFYQWVEDNCPEVGT